MATKDKGSKHMNVTDKPHTAAVSAVLPHEEIKRIQLTDIHVDWAWNVRSERRVQDLADTESEGFEGLAHSIEATGQDTPVILRNTEGGKTLAGKSTKAPYELVCGFRRYKAISMLMSGQKLADATRAGKPVVPNLGNGTILAVVRPVHDALEARVLNGKENTARSNLKAPDLTKLVKELSDRGMKQGDIVIALGITQGWVSKLQKIATLPPAILDHWRDGKPIPQFVTKEGAYSLAEGEGQKELTVPQMWDLADLKNNTPEDLTARYVRILKPEGSADGPGAAPSQKDPVLDKVKEIAAICGALVNAGVLDSGNLDWARVLGDPKKGFPLNAGKSPDAARIQALSDAASDAYESAFPANKAAS